PPNRKAGRCAESARRRPSLAARFAVEADRGQPRNRPGGGQRPCCGNKARDRRRQLRCRFGESRRPPHRRDPRIPPRPQAMNARAPSHAELAATIKSERAGVEALVEELAAERQALTAGETDRVADRAPRKRE